MSRTLTEKKVLKKLGIPDFRHLTKDKVVQFMSMLPRMDPEVAKKALEQYPEMAKSVVGIATDFKETLEKGMNDNAESVKAFYETCNSIIDSLKQDLADDEITREERERIYDRMVILAQMIQAKDTENKQFILKVLGIAGGVAATLAAVIAATLGTNTSLNGGRDDADIVLDETDYREID